jgi:mRNA interferase RelE/StbE
LVYTVNVYTRTKAPGKRSECRRGQCRREEVALASDGPASLFGEQTTAGPYRAADKALRKLPVKVQRRIAAATEALADEPRPTGCAKLHGTDDLWRIRVGQYRVVYTIEDEDLIVLVVRVAPRKDIDRP